MAGVSVYQRAKRHALKMLVGVAIAWLICTYLNAHSEPDGSGWLLACVAIPTVAFLLHPLNTQAVTYVVQRMASLSALFVIVSITLYIAARQKRNGRRAAPLWSSPHNRRRCLCCISHDSLRRPVFQLGWSIL